MTNVYYAIVNSTSCIKKEERRNKLRSILNPDLLIISFLKIKYTYVNILFIYLFFIFFFIYHSFKLVKGGFICKLFEDRWGIFFFHYVNILIFDDVHSSACNIGHFLGQAFSGIFFCFLKCIEKELQIWN
jgi:hypothetical protein